MIPKSGNRFSDKIMLDQKDEGVVRFNAVETDSKVFHSFMKMVKGSSLLFDAFSSRAPDSASLENALDSMFQKRLDISEIRCRPLPILLISRNLMQA